MPFVGWSGVTSEYGQGGAVGGIPPSSRHRPPPTPPCSIDSKFDEYLYPSASRRFCARTTAALSFRVELEPAVALHYRHLGVPDQHLVRQPRSSSNPSRVQDFAPPLRSTVALSHPFPSPHQTRDYHRRWNRTSGRSSAYLALHKEGMD